MSQTFRAHFDGRAIKPDEPVRLLPGTPLLVTLLKRVRGEKAEGRFAALAGRLAKDDARQMHDMIDREFEGIEGEW